MASSKRPLSEGGDIGEGSGRLKRSRGRDANWPRISLPVLTREDLLPHRAMQEVRPLLTDSAPPVPRYQLRFQNCLPPCVYTCHEIMAKDKDPLQISLVDTATGDCVASGPLSSENIMVLVLDGHFCGTKQRDKKEFENHIVHQRVDKGPLLKGKLVIQLTSGVGYLQDISFTDNSSRRPSKKFRLAVCCETEGIQEGISNPFRVKEHRSYLNEKHHPPKLTDQVWNLVNIRKDGVYHRRLTAAGILNVQQFLQALSVDPENLRRLLQNGSLPKRRIPDKEWEAIIINAQECFPGDQLYSYDVGQDSTLIFNSVYLLLGAKVNGWYHDIKNLNATDKAFLEKLQRQAFEYQASIKLDDMCIQEFSDLVTASISLSVPCPQCSVEASRQVKLFESFAPPYSQLGHTNQEDTSEQFHPLTIPPTHAAFPGQNLEELGSSCFSDYVQPEVDSSMPDIYIPDTCNFQDVFQLEDLMDNQSEINNHPGFFAVSSEHVYPRRLSFSSLSDNEIDEFLRELEQSDPIVRSTRKWVKLVAVLKWGLFAYISARELGNTSDHPIIPTMDNRRTIM
ncbi:calmodulin-binding protein 60 F-like isoform X2 [Zingiber officinale]|uniref:calmodulin-binding protein 60 F-like isoform X2 n=1 Tax=Zingiber officinale TaxID=94328 RepID=UPI001C4DA357|nr:calmodulin-binding protein 60 F-like isoform X2 [Zingiber officinale]